VVEHALLEESLDAATGVPDDYKELFEAYFPIMCHIVYKAGIAKEDVEDVTMDLLIKFMEKDGIAYYDPGKATKFSSMLRGFTSTYVLDKRDRQEVRHRRNPWRLDAVDDLELVDPLDSTFDYVETSVALQQVLREARRQLVTKSNAKRDYATFFDACMRHGLTLDRIDRAALEKELGLTASVTRRMLDEVRNVLRPLVVGLEAHSLV
jgi:DNA-directed RNA polymerase specialized sigma24 family protein